jgi:hypothetical protein
MRLTRALWRDLLHQTSRSNPTSHEAPKAVSNEDGELLISCAHRDHTPVKLGAAFGEGTRRRLVDRPAGATWDWRILHDHGVNCQNRDSVNTPCSPCFGGGTPPLAGGRGKRAAAAGGALPEPPGAKAASSTGPSGEARLPCACSNCNVGGDCHAEPGSTTVY